MIPKETIEAIKAKADIVSVIGQYIKLEKKGADYKGLCPFHKDTHPSLSVSPSKRVFKCFSCGAAGDVIKFVQDFKHISYPEAIAEVGATCGVTVARESGESARYAMLSRYKDIMDAATSFYVFCLNQTQEGQIALDYLHKRQLSDDVIKHFKIGAAPREEGLLTQHLSEEGVLPLDLIKVGLARASEQTPGGYYDVFRNRVMFPLDGLDGRIVGFSGRIYAAKGDAKYVNTSENAVFHKGSLLYHYAEAMNPAAQEDRIYLFEGFMDVIACYRAGILNAVASMGTALTREQIQALLKVTKNVVIVYDGDAPGIAATKKAIGLFRAAGITPEACLFPDGMDPDEYINRYGAEALVKHLTTARESAIDYGYRVSSLGKDLTKTEDRDAFRREVFALLKAFANPVYTADIMGRLEKDLGIPRKELEASFAASPTEESPFKTPSFSEAPPVIPGETDEGLIPPDDYLAYPAETSTQPLPKNKVTSAEERLIWFEYRDKTLANRIELTLGESTSEITLWEIRKGLHDFYADHEVMDADLLAAARFISPDAQDRLTKILALYPDHAADEEYVKELMDCLKVAQAASAVVVAGDDDDARLKALAKKKRLTTRVKLGDEGKYGK